MDELDDSFFSCSSSCVSDGSYASAFSDTSVLLGDLLKSRLSVNKRFLNIVHINAQSVPAHYSDLLSSFDSSVVDAILISETFLKPSLASKQYFIPGYRLLRNDRTGKGGGGVAIYLRADIPHKILDVSPSQYSHSAEHLFIEVTFQHTKLLMGVLYSPSSQIDYFSSLETKLELLSPLYEHTIILGDFNTCLLKSDYRTQKLLSLVTSLNMEILPLSATHHAPQYANPSLLDLILVSNPSMVVTHGQLSAPFSFHDLIYLTYKIRPPKPKPKFILVRNYKGIDVERLRSDARSADWSDIFLSDSIDGKISHLNRTLTDLYDRHAPVKCVRVKRLPAPWLTDEVKRAMSKRDKAKRRLRRNPSEENLLAYKSLRNRCNRMCRDAKRRHIHNNIEDLPTSQVWKFLKSLGVGKSSHDESPVVDLNALNTHFSRSPVILEDGIKSATLNNLSQKPLPKCTPFSFAPVSECDVKRSFKSISTKAVGADGVHLQMILLILEILAPVFTHIFNFSLLTGSFPTIWKKAQVIPLPKTPNPLSFSQYRPISILPIMSKVLESIVQKQLSTFLNRNNLLSQFQSGFRPGHSTVTALLKVSDDIRLAIDKKQLTVLTLLDFSSAFNSVDFDVLLGILKSLNVSPPALIWFDSYLRGRSQCVRYDDVSSDWCDLSAGVPQGGVLSPLLFSVFINAITYTISSHFHLYADDLQLYRHFKVGEIQKAISAMNSDLSSVCDWAKSFGLLVNPAKSQVMILGSSYMLNCIQAQGLPRVCYDGVDIDYSSCAKNLGVMFDNKLSWVNHVNDVSRKLHYSFHSLKRLQWFLPFKTKVMLAQSLLLPLLDYADVCYLDATEVLLNKLERLQNLCIRFIYGLRKYDHVSSYRSQLKWLPIRRRRDLHVVSTLYSILNNPSAPQYLRERFVYMVPRGKPCRESKSLLLWTPSHTSSSYGDSFTVHSVRLWNLLPHSIRASTSVEVFRKKVKEHYLSE